jgi:hypothetical protein
MKPIMEATESGCAAIFNAMTLPRDVTSRRSNEEIAQSRGRAILVGEAHHNVEAPVTIDDLRYSSPIREGVQRLRHRSWCQPVQRRAFIVDLDAQLRDEHLFFDLEIDQARHRRKLLACPLGETTKRFQVVDADKLVELRSRSDARIGR